MSLSHEEVIAYHREHSLGLPPRKESVNVTSTHDATKTHFCKTVDCENESPSSRGIMAYCKTCRAKRLADPDAPGRVKISTNEQKVRDLLNAARRLDRAENNARKAIDEVKQARIAHRSALAPIAEQLGVRHEADA